MNQIEIKFTGAVLDLRIELEGREVGLYFDGASEWTRTLERFKIEDKLDLVLLCKGANGTKWSLEIIVDQTGPKVFTGKIIKGYSLESYELEIPLKT